MSKFTLERAKTIVDAMRGGAGLGPAAEMAGVTRQTIWNWRKEGQRAGRGGKYELDVDISKVEAANIAMAEQTVKRIMRSRDDDKVALNAAQWFLERKAPEEYGRQDKLTIDVANQAQQLLDFLRDRLDADTYDRVLAAIAPNDSDGSTVGRLN